MPIISVQKLEGANLDAETIEEVVNGEPNTTVVTRKGRIVPTLATLGEKHFSTGVIVEGNKTQQEINQENTLAISGLSTNANKYYPTLAAATADIANIAVNAPVQIGEVENGGLWVKKTTDATSLERSPYDLVSAANQAIDLANNTINSASELSQVVEVATETTVNESIRAELNADRAELAAIAAATDNLYGTMEEGVTATDSGDYFYVVSASNERVADLYKNNAGVAEPLNKSTPSSNAKWRADQIIDASGVNQQTINDSTYPKLRDQFVSVWDFFTKAEQQAYNLALINGAAATYDSHRQLQAFLDYIASNDVNTAYCSADLYVSKGVKLGGVAGSLTKNVIGRLKLTAIVGSVIDDLFVIQAGQNFKWYGFINVVGTGGIIYSARTVKRGFRLGGEYASSHSWIQAVRAEGGFIEYGVLVGDFTTGSCIDDVRTTRCGSGHYKPDNSSSGSWSLYSDYTIYSENTSGGTTQETVLQVSTLPPDWLYYLPMVVINEKLYHVKSIDVANSRISIRPLLDRNDLTFTRLRYMFGAGVLVAGSDASVVRIGKYNATDNAIAMHSGALYAPIITALTAESNGIGLLIGGGTTSQAHVGGSIGSFYCENNVWDIVRRTNAQLSYTITNTNYEQDFSRFASLSALRNASTNNFVGDSGLDGVQIGYKGQALAWESRSLGENNTTAIDVTDVNRSEYWHYGSSKVFNIVVPNLPINKVFGYNRKPCVVVGAGNNGNPTGDIVFNAPAGYTVNGEASVTFNGFTQAAKFDVYLQYARNNFVVTCSTLGSKTLSASVTYDPESLATNEIKYWNVTLTGAKLGDMVACSFDKSLNGTRIWAEVTGANIVTVYHQNPTASLVDLAAGILKVKVF